MGGPWGSVESASLDVSARAGDVPGARAVCAAAQPADGYPGCGISGGTPGAVVCLACGWQEIAPGRAEYCSLPCW